MLRKNEFVFIWIGILLLLPLFIIKEGNVFGFLGILRLLMACLFVVFAPGYALLATLMPGKSQIGILERLSFSFALSIAILSIMALILDHLPWGITLWPVIIFLVGFTLVMTFLAIYRRSRLPDQERVLFPQFNIRQRWQGQSPFRKIAFCCVIATVSLGMVGFITTFSQPNPNAFFTDFYMLSVNRAADMYPSRPDESVTVRLGIDNNEQTSGIYTILVYLDGEQLFTTDPIPVGVGQRWENDFAVSIGDTGSPHVIAFQLMRNGGTTPYRSLRLEIQAP